MSVAVVNFYQFVALGDLAVLRATLKDHAARLGLKGTILLAPEGLNCALAGDRSKLEDFLKVLAQVPDLALHNLKWSEAERCPFRYLKVRIKRWIIRFAEADDPTVAAIQNSPHLSPHEVRDLLTQGDRSDLIIVDTRNDYETAVGMFADAIHLPIKTFTQFPQAFLAAFAEHKDKTFLFYCTGGVRCEKVVPWAVAQGFTKATQIDGGILNYFATVGSEGYRDQCFVFDDRTALDHELKAISG